MVVTYTVVLLRTEKDFMGRIYQKPLAQSRGQDAEVYINLGSLRLYGHPQRNAEK